MVVDTLDLTFGALADPTRRAILDRLRAGPATVNQLAEPFGITQQAVSKHVAYLERATLVEKRREGRLHVCMLRPDALERAASWMDGYRRYWDEAFTQLDDVLDEMKRRRKEP